MSIKNAKSEIKKAIENQIHMKNPKCTAQAYEKLQDLGFKKEKAKDILTETLFAEMMEMMAKQIKFDEKHYANRLDKLLVDFAENGLEYVNSFRRIEHLIDEGYEAAEKEDGEKIARCFKKAWSILKQQIVDTGINDIEELVKDSTYTRITITNWMSDIDLELANAREYEAIKEICSEILQYVKVNLHTEGNLKRAVADAYSSLGDVKTSDELYEKWIKEKPDDGNLYFGWALTLENRKEYNKAIKLVEAALKDSEIDFRSELCEVAERLYEVVGDTEQEKFYNNKWKEEIQKEKVLRYGNRQESMVKAKKVYPNDPCPCGSGKKYKKCCGCN